MGKSKKFDWTKVLVTSLVISLTSLLTFSAFIYIYDTYKNKKDAKEEMLSIVSKINDGENYHIFFHGKTQRDSIDDYTKMSLGLNPGVISISEYTIRDLHDIPVYEVIFEWTPDVNPAYSIYDSISVCTGKYKRSGTRNWEYFSSPETIRQDLRRLASEGKLLFNSPLVSPEGFFCFIISHTQFSLPNPILHLHYKIK